MRDVRHHVQPLPLSDDDEDGLHLFIYLVCVCVFMWKFVLSYHVDPGDQTQLVRLGGKYIYLLIGLTSSLF